MVRSWFVGGTGSRFRIGGAIQDWGGLDGPDGPDPECPDCCGEVESGTARAGGIRGTLCKSTTAGYGDTGLSFRAIYTTLHYGDVGESSVLQVLRTPYLVSITALPSLSDAVVVVDRRLGWAVAICLRLHVVVVVVVVGVSLARRYYAVSWSQACVGFQGV